MSLWESCAFTEHGDKRTDYLRVLRVAFLRPVKPTQETLTYKLSQKIFSPRPVKPREEAKNNNEQAQAAVTEKTFEDLQTVEGRVNSWLIRSGN